MDCLNPLEPAAAESPYEVLLRAVLLIPVSHYLLGLSLIVVVFLYNFLEIHILQDLFTGLRGQKVVLTFHPSSQLYRDVVSKCRILHGRYLSTPWLCSPHLQTVFLHFLGNSPVLSYRRQIFITSDGGTLALDWVKNVQVKNLAYQVNDVVEQDDKKPILIIIPGLTSDSNSAYVKHLAFSMAKHGWNVVVSNHRGLGGVSITSDCFYNAGWTEDVRKVIDHLHCQFPEAPLFLVGTSIGANILVKYLAEDGINAPIVGAAAICSPWDLLICDRFINRKLAQRFYNKALTIGLKDYAHLHEDVLSRLSNWEGVKKSRSVRDFDDCATRVLGNYETVDTYYRRSSSSNFVGSVTTPLLCISSLDDPVCTSEAIPWDECRLNTNVVLAVTQHGGHLPFFEGLTAKSVWWVRAVDEFFGILQSSPLSHRKKQTPDPATSPLDPSIDQAPYVHVKEDGMVSAANNQVAEIEVQHQENMDENKSEETLHAEPNVQEKQNTKVELTQPPDVARSPEQDITDIVAPVKRCLNQLSRQNRKSLWLLAYIAILTTWPVVGSALSVFLRKRFQDLLSRVSGKR
ncbi:embryogenesis-associated protein EMB8-like isoform X1 [Sesamum indicum]|uniref:Embryogenesis-associated protein EMB8-like isoform X1 n=1 Tax=Sesamum indicum TaxID=4182 RepID=A0A6I9UDS8_SESIN|nr:embryogenesis-associated protein EMB8-like isoform X1 [Sesamum indicum]